MSFGLHLMLDLSGCPEHVLEDLDEHFNFLNEMPSIIGMTKITAPHVFRYSGLVPEDRGITGTVIIAESHMSIHSFQEKGYCFIDVFSCNMFDVDTVIAEIECRFQPTSITQFKAIRGKDFPR